MIPVSYNADWKSHRIQPHQPVRRFGMVREPVWMRDYCDGKSLATMLAYGGPIK